MLYEIAEHRLRLTFKDSYQNDSLLPSFAPFRVEEDSHAPLIDITVDDSLKSVSKGERRLIRDVDTGNGIIQVFRLKTHDDKPNGYQFVIGDVTGFQCALLITNEDFRQCRCALRGDNVRRIFALNSLVMLCFAFATASLDTVLVHASLVRHEGKGYAFTAKSGTGKSTQVSNWLRYIPDCDLMNDDNPVIRIKDDDVYIYGSPWSGKTPCYRNVKAPLGAMALIHRDNSNFLERLKPIKAFVTLLPACSTMKWDERVYRANGDTVSKVLERIPVYALHCLPDKDSAIVASAGMKKGI